jgi:novobiocin biosynthesis protein NovU/D-mycarose 3-C-methyltransferase
MEESMTLYQEHNTCRACGNRHLIPVFDLGYQALANCFRTPDEEPAPKAPLCVLYCETCTLAQLSVVVNPEILYSNYAYTTPSSTLQSHHMKRLADALFMDAAPRNHTALEIGSNDGAFLEVLRNRGCEKVWGCDPSMPQCVKALNERKIPSYNWLFSENTAVMPPMDIVVARHVFCHVDDWPDFIRGLIQVTHSQSLIAIEVPSTRVLVGQLLWDTIYHEHTSYLTLHAIGALLKGTPLRVDRVLDYDLHGGSVVYLLRYRDHAHTMTPVEESWITREDWMQFAKLAVGQRENLIRSVVRLRASDKVVAGYGAPAKATVVANACKWSSSDIKFVTDTTPEKVGKVLPGTDIVVVGDEMLELLQPDYAVMFAWNYHEEIRKAKHQYVKKGGAFIYPHGAPPL